jgi:alpha-amylase
MPSVCFYFQVHQPYRLRQYSFFESASEHSPHQKFFDDQKNGDILRKVANKCYLPTNRLLLELIEQYKGDFRVSFSITGTAIDQMQAYCPEALDTFKQLAKTGCVEFISETYYHSLSALYDVDEFKAQVLLHKQKIQSVFGTTPTIFRDTELIYDDRIGRIVAEMGYKGVIAEGADDILGWRSPNFLYNVPDTGLKLLLKNYRLSDDIAFRFSNRGWAEWPLSADKFASWVHQVSGNGDTVNLFMDYETFGEHQWADTGIFEFLRHLPRFIMAHPDWKFHTPSQVVDAYPSRAPLSYHRLTSWADLERDTTAWRGNRMQERSLEQIYSISQKVLATKNPELVDVWRKLQTSDHFYYMCTKWFSDGDVHAYFSPYPSPYEAFINFQNVLKDFSLKL